MDNTLENSFVEKVVLKNNLAQPAQIEEAKGNSSITGKTLLETLKDLTVLGDEQAAQITKMFEKYRQTQLGAAGTGGSGSNIESAPPPAAPQIQRIGPAGGAAPQIQRIGPATGGAPAAGVQRIGPSGGAPAVQKIGPAAPSVQKIGPAAGGAPKINPVSSGQFGQGQQLRIPSSTPKVEPQKPVPSASSSAPTIQKIGPSATTAAPQIQRISAASAHMQEAPPTPKDVSQYSHVHHYLEYARKIGASDLHLNTNSPPIIRKYGKLIPLGRPPLTAQDAEKLLMSILTKPQREELEEKRALDFCYTVKDEGRYRTCILKQRNGWDGSFRVVKSEVPTFEELGLPADLKRLTQYHQGLVLVTGPNGCGKSTTMATLLNLINHTREEHIISIEDPVEYIFEPAKCQVNQREVGQNTKSFANALRAALREDPDIIMIGELRDEETVSLAITAAETGHLVFGTLHTTSAGRTIDRVLDVFPPEEQGQIRSMISESIKGIICQQLIPRKDGEGRALAMEILFNTPAVANLIRERKLHQLPSAMQTGRKLGMVLLDDALMTMVKDGTIDGADAFFSAENKATFAQWAPKAL
jgi:twitching motility protein PilT